MFFNYIKCFFLFILLLRTINLPAQKTSPHDLRFNDLAHSWDEGIPLGNGMLGALIWEKDSQLRISLDRADLWDLRPVKEFGLPQFSFDWVKEQVERQTYDTVQKLFDLPYERDPAPTRLPAGALEFLIGQPGEVESVVLYLDEAVCLIKWKNGMLLRLFVDANSPLGWFRFENVPGEIEIRLDTPKFSGQEEEIGNSVGGQGLQRLGYPEGNLFIDPSSIYYKQKGWSGFEYEIAVMWKNQQGKSLEGAWSITTRGTPYSDMKSAWTYVSDALGSDHNEALKLHREWWSKYWKKSAIHLPDTILENQWYREIYKFGSASRFGSPPISLQAIWTADNGRLPPWKGDFHNDLNTQMSYWPGYTSNHLDESRVYTDWISRNLKSSEAYTKVFYDNSGLNYPGVCTLTGEPMGGWIQYACSPTVSAWLAQHFYLQWKYSMDSAFMADQAYPFLFRTCLFIREISEKNRKYRNLPLSSSPEINDNSIKAWFRETTNFDLALIRNLYFMAAEMSAYFGKNNDERFFSAQLNEWPDLAVDQQKGLLAAPGYPLRESHRHFSHLMAIYPLDLIDIRNGKKDKSITESSLKRLDSLGTSNWCGYSYAWLGNLEARAGNGENAANALKTFATCFCLPNSFHVNGDQSGTGKTNFTYRPFTLEGNFGFASGIQEMLLQSHGDIITVFPAIPGSWQDVSFENLRAQGAFVISAEKKDGRVKEVKIFAEKGGRLSIVNPFDKGRVQVEGASAVKFRKADLFEIQTTPGQTIIFTSISRKK